MVWESDATIETADVVIQNDQPSKIVSEIKVGKVTRSIVWQNIVMAMVVKAYKDKPRLFLPGIFKA